MAFTHRNFQKIASQFHIQLLTSVANENPEISWLHYMEDPAYTSWLRGHELILITGSIIGDDVKKLKSFIDAIYEKNAAGLIINLSPYIHEVPEEIIRYASFIGFPLYVMPADCAIIEISERVCQALSEYDNKKSRYEALLYHLIYEKPKLTNSLIKRAVNSGFHQDIPYYCIIFRFSPEAEEVQSDETFYLFDSVLNNHLPTMEIEPLSAYFSNQYLLLLPCNTETDTFISDQLPKILDFFCQKKNIVIHAGISPSWTGLNELQNNYTKAETALNLLPFHKDHKQIMQFCDLDPLFLLLSQNRIEELKDFYLHALQPLITYDQTNHGDLLHTLNVFIQNSGSLCASAQKLFIHTNTMRYRIQKIENLLNCSLKDYDTLFSLYMNLRIYYYTNLKNQ